MSDLPTTATPRTKKERLAHWYASPAYVQTMRVTLADPAIREAFDLAIEAGAPLDLTTGPDGQATLVAHALTNARTAGWMSALQFLRNLAETPKPAPVELKPWQHHTTPIEST